MIDILGLKNSTSLELIKDIWKTKSLKNELSEVTYKQLISIANKNEFKPINESLKPLIGVYPLGTYKFPKWWSEFKVEYVNFITDYMKDEIVEDYNKDKNELKETQKLIETVELLGRMTPQNLKEGKLPNGEKIIKRLKKTAEMITEYDNDVLNTQWNRIYETNKTSTGDEYVVITNSISSTIGMSSYFENPEHSSCMTILKGNNARSYAKGLWSNVLDKNSLILYVTNGSERGFYNEDILSKSYPHQAMTTRYILRLIKTEDLTFCTSCGGIKEYTESEKSYCPHCKEVTNNKQYEQPERIGVVLDRAYPHNAYTHSILKLLKELCDKNNLTLFYHVLYNDTQTTNEDNNKYDIDLTTKEYRALDVEPIPYTHSKDYDNVCEECSKYISFTSCQECDPFSNEICKTCAMKNKKYMKCARLDYKDETDYCRNPQNTAFRAYADNAIYTGSAYNKCNAFDNEHYRTQYRVKMVKEVL